MTCFQASEQPTAATTLLEQSTAAAADLVTAKQAATAATLEQPAAATSVKAREQSAATVTSVGFVLVRCQSSTNQQCERGNTAHHSPIHRILPRFRSVRCDPNSHISKRARFLGLHFSVELPNTC
ncbi:MAG: hypothetical protein AAGI63_05270, partial [Planctomycetota bacterium]